MDPDKVLNWHFFVLLVLFIGTLVIYFKMVWESWGGGLIQRPKTKTLLLLGHLQQWAHGLDPSLGVEMASKDDDQKLLPGQMCYYYITVNKISILIQKWSFGSPFILACKLRILTEDAKSHWLHLFDFSRLCVFKCCLKFPACEDAKSHWLHLCDFSPLCIFKCALKESSREDA